MDANRTWTRRSFVAGASATVGLSASAARAVRRANDRLAIGIIGCGGRGRALMSQIQASRQQHNVIVTALCDVWKVNLQQAGTRVEQGFGHAPRTFTRFGDLLALNSVDAVVIATPDFAHTPILIAALEAGKDVYVEKPMSLEVRSANKALDLTRSSGRIVQVGTQRRSDGAFIAAAKVLASGVLGQISRITASVNFNHPRWRRPYADCRAQDVDWKAYLFNRPERPFDPRLLRRWHFYREFTNGLSGLWMSHYVDGVHMLTGARYPANAVANGGTYVWHDGREHCDTFHAALEYPEGFLFQWGMSLGNSAGNHWTVHGTRGMFDVENLALSPRGGARGSEVPAKRIEATKSASHMENWLECIRSRQRPNGDIQYGHQHAVATIMAAAALHTGQRQAYDPKKREVQAG